jgi:hypothetical protein
VMSGDVLLLTEGMFLTFHPHPRGLDVQVQSLSVPCSVPSCEMGGCAGDPTASSAREVKGQTEPEVTWTRGGCLQTGEWLRRRVAACTRCWCPPPDLKSPLLGPLCSRLQPGKPTWVLAWVFLCATHQQFPLDPGDIVR